MRFSIERAKLVEALEPAAKVAKKAASMEIISHCLISTGQGQVCVKGTDMETFVSRIAEAEVAEAGICTAEARTLLGVIKANKSEKVLLETTASDTVRLGMDGAWATFRTLDSQQYPVFDDQINYWFDAEPAQMLADISCVMVACETKGARPFLQTVFMETRGDRLLLSAADGKMMARITRQIAGETRKAMIPRRFLRVLPAMLKGDNVVVGTSGENENLACFHTDDCRISSRVYEGEFPDFEALMTPFSDNHAASFNLDRIQMDAIMKLMRPMATGLDRPVLKLRLESDVLHLAHKGNNGDALVTQIGVSENRGEDFTVFLNLDYVGKLLTCFGQHETIYFGFTGPMQPVYFQNAGEPLVTQAVAMPIANVTWMEDIG